ncbi:MAG TPA: RidA family protein [Methylibium sp.]|nr:RidA family protein [Methylibium sp.]
MSSPRDTLLRKFAADLGLDPAEAIVAVPKYEPTVEHDGQLFVSGQIPRLRGEVAVVGRIGAETDVEAGRQAARLCVVRALMAVRQSAGTLERVQRVLRMNVYLRCAPEFAALSEVADAASEILYAVFKPDGGHTRTTVGVAQLPKHAAVELDLLVALGAPERSYSTF